jgi:predicted ArsR family transcriptional regulator
MTFNVKTVAPILVLLRKRPWSVPELAEEAGITRETARTLCKTLHDEGLVYVQYWTLMGSYWSPSYRWGMNPDAEKIKPARVRKSRAKPKITSFDPFYNMCRP